MSPEKRTTTASYYEEREFNIAEVKNKHEQRATFSEVDTSLQDFASPAPAHQVRAGIDPSMISPIPNQGDNGLGGASVARYINGSPQEYTEEKSNYKSPSRHQAYLDNEASKGNEELNKSMSPSRDLARKMQS